MALWKKAARAKLLKEGRWCRALCSRAEVCVFWDLNKCGVEDAEMEEAEGKVNASIIAPNIVKSLRSSGFSGPISIRAYGNTRSFSNFRVMKALLATGVDLHHTSGGMNYLSKHLILDLLLWVKENAPPAHMLLISGDKEFSSVLHKLHMRGYNVLLAHPERDISADLLSSASKVWVWDKMMKGMEESAVPPNHKCLPQTHRSFNHNELQYYYQEVQPELDVNHDFVCDNIQGKPLNIPGRVVKQVLKIIRSRPSGFTVPAFRRQLVRSNIALDKDFYGHKDLLSFLLSIPNLKTRLVWTSDRTRTFCFTENLDHGGSTKLNSDGEEAYVIGSDHSKDANQQEILKAAQGRRHSGIKMKNVSCSQQLNNEVSTEKSCEGKSTKMFSGVDLSSHDSASSDFFSGGTSVLLDRWNKTLLKLLSWNFIGFLVGPKAAKTDKAFLNLPFTTKRRERKPENGMISTEPYISSVSSPNPEEENSGVAYKKKSRETMEGAIGKVMHPSSIFEAGQEIKKSSLVQKGNLLASADCIGTYQTRSEIDSGLGGQGRQRGLKSEIDITPLLCDEKITLTDELREDVFTHLFNEGGTMFTRSIRVEDLLKFLLESNLKGISELKQEELIQLSKVCHEKIMLQVQKEEISNRKPEASKCDKVFKDGRSMPASTSTIKPDSCQLSEREGGLAWISFENGQKENCCGGSQIRKESVSVDQSMPEADVCNDKPEANSMHAAEVCSDVKKMLLDSLQGYDDKVELGRVKPNFKMQYGYELHNKSLGYCSLSSFISSFKEFTVIDKSKVKLRLPEHAVDKGEEEGNNVSLEVSN